MVAIRVSDTGKQTFQVKHTRAVLNRHVGRFYLTIVVVIRTVIAITIARRAMFNAITVGPRNVFVK